MAKLKEQQQVLAAISKSTAAVLMEEKLSRQLRKMEVASVLS